MKGTAYSDVFISKIVKGLFLPSLRATQYNNVIL